MQTIARANRVYKEKINGLIVDYIGIFRYLEKALAIYATGPNEDVSTPIEDKSELINLLKDAISEITQFCTSINVDFTKIQNADQMSTIELIDDAVNNILINDETKSEYLQQARHIYKLFKAILPDPDANEFSTICSLINIISNKIKSIGGPVDISSVEDEVEDLLDRSIAPDGYIIDNDSVSYHDQNIDLSQIDIDELIERFETQHKRTHAERLKGIIKRKLKEMIQLNKSRIDLQDKFEKMIEEYNSGSITDDQQLVKIHDLLVKLSQEDKRAESEELSEEELAIYDILTKPDIQMTLLQRQEVKSTVKNLIEELKYDCLVLDWRKHQKSTAQVKSKIAEVLENGLPDVYNPMLFHEKYEEIYQHIFESYFGEDKSVYTQFEILQSINS